MNAIIAINACCPRSFRNPVYRYTTQAQYPPDVPTKCIETGCINTVYPLLLPLIMNLLLPLLPLLLLPLLPLTSLPLLPLPLRLCIHVTVIVRNHRRTNHDTLTAADTATEGAALSGGIAGALVGGVGVVGVEVGG
ncbi:hypothetical protein B484DRAFT_10762 [Ochromonadaceae sp. CCMP2298]|nr:hypothetical protein B484DRAFT_10762 [Ochromonadaceae sp. CCMP2298]